jgi:hypothetical protein
MMDYEPTSSVVKPTKKGEKAEDSAAVEVKAKSEE